MNDEKEKWIEEVFNSMKGSQRATPKPELFVQIANQITDSKSNVIPMHQWRSVAAVAAFILFMNVTTSIYYNQYDQLPNEDIAISDVYGQSLISSYQIYD